MRSVGDFPVNKICQKYFNGGGHLNAAGGEFNGTLEEAINLFSSLVEENKRLYIDNKDKE
jgi:phosphoesterase RecJ-like protein